MSTWMITGANGNLGKRLTGVLLADPDTRVSAVVRSERAASAIKEIELSADAAARLQVHIVDYHNVDALREVAQGCDKAVHLVGILKETRAASYQDAHEDSCGALVTALDGTPVSHLTYMSIVGSTPTEENACLASKGRAEALCLAGGVPCCVLRVPMVLGEGDYASFALSKRARSRRSFTFRAQSLEQPIYAGDVVQAIIAAGDAGVQGTLDLGGPEVLTRRALTERAAAVLEQPAPLVISLPVGLGIGMAFAMEKLSANPPVTTAMLGVLDHDDDIDPTAAQTALGIDALTPLDDMLRAVLASG